MDEVGETTLRIMKIVGWYNNWLFSLIEPHVRGNILEVGAGIGNFTLLLSKKGKVTAIDINEKYVKNLGELVGKKAKVGYGDIEKGRYFFKDEKFDSIVCLNVLEHIKADRKALANMYKFLKPGGKLILLVPAHEALFGTLDKGLGHIRRYTTHRLIKKLSATGFKILKVKYLNMLGFLGWFTSSRVLRKRVLPSSQLKIFNYFSRPFLRLEEKYKPPFGLSVLAIAEKE